MDKKLRELERKALGGDTEARRALTIEYTRLGKGYCLFWIGDAKPCEGAVSSQLTYDVPTSVHPHDCVARDRAMARHFYLLAIDDLRGLEHYLHLKPHGILNLETKKHQFFNTPYQFHRNNIRHHPTVAILDGLYETKTLPAGNYSADSEELTFFQGYLSDIGVTRVEPSPRRTTLIHGTSQSGRSKKYACLPYPQNYVVLGISLLPMPGTHRDSFIELIKKTQFRFYVGTMDYVRISSVLVASMPGIEAGDQRSTISAPIAPILSLPEEIDLIPMQNFLAELIPTEPFTLTHPVELLLNFHGHYRRETL